MTTLFALLAALQLVVFGPETVPPRIAGRLRLSA
jgi:hypothetical protein